MSAFEGPPPLPPSALTSYLHGPLGLGKLIFFLSSGWFGFYSYVAQSVSLLGITFLEYFHQEKSALVSVYISC